MREHGGLRGIDDEAALVSAMERPQKRWEEEGDKPDLARLAAGYGHALATDKPFRDGNTRVAFLAMTVFLELNGRVVTVTEEEALTTMVLLSEDKLSRKKLAAWIRERMAPD